MNKSLLLIALLWTLEPQLAVSKACYVVPTLMRFKYDWINHCMDWFCKRKDVTRMKMGLVTCYYLPGGQIVCTSGRSCTWKSDYECS
jgi:hypothetical protein